MSTRITSVLSISIHPGLTAKLGAWEGSINTFPFDSNGLIHSLYSLKTHPNKPEKRSLGTENSLYKTGHLPF